MSMIQGGADVNRKYDEVVPLQIALGKNNCDMFRTLIAAGANVNIVDTYGTPLIVSVCHKYDIEFLEALLKGKADKDKVDTSNRTALMVALEYNQTKHIDCLIKAKAKVNHTDNFGCNPLMYAIKHCSAQVVEKLLIAGADYKFKHNDKNALTYALESNIHNPNYDLIVYLCKYTCKKSKKDLMSYSMLCRSDLIENNYLIMKLNFARIIFLKDQEKNQVNNKNYPLDDLKLSLSSGMINLIIKNETLHYDSKDDVDYKYFLNWLVKTQSGHDKFKSSLTSLFKNRLITGDMFLESVFGHKDILKMFTLEDDIINDIAKTHTSEKSKSQKHFLMWLIKTQSEHEKFKDIINSLIKDDEKTIDIFLEGALSNFGVIKFDLNDDIIKKNYTFKSNFK